MPDKEEDKKLDEAVEEAFPDSKGWEWLELCRCDPPPSETQDSGPPNRYQLCPECGGVV